jgi:hypothetical protein
METPKINNLSPGAYRYYIHNVRGNENTDFETARRKLSRNIQLGIKAPKVEGKPDGIYYYGNLTIKLVNDTIVWLNNYHRPLHSLLCTDEEYNKASEEYSVHGKTMIN